MAALADKICTTCNGSGEFRSKSADMHPAFNIYGFAYSEAREEWFGECRSCGGRGFIRLRSLPPLIQNTA